MSVFSDLLKGIEKSSFHFFMWIYFAFASFFVAEFARWYMHLPAAERGYEESGAMVGLCSALIGFGKTIFDTYVDMLKTMRQAP